MKKKILFTSILLMIIFMTFAVSSCSVIGLGAGIMIDSNKPDSTRILPDQKIDIKKGTLLSILLKDNRLLIGRYVETGRLSQEDYSEYYMSKQRMLTGQDYLPLPGDTIYCHFQIQPHREYKGVLLGFDKDSLEIQRTGLPRMSVIPFKNLRGITGSNGRFIEIDRVMISITSGQIPVFSALIVSNEVSEVQVPMNEIAEIKWKTKKDMKWRGLFGGLCMDAMITVMIISSLDFDITLDGQL